jgi:hypothetical protein
MTYVTSLLKELCKGGLMTDNEKERKKDKYDKLYASIFNNVKVKGYMPQLETTGLRKNDIIFDKYYNHI